MIVIGYGANLDSEYGSPFETFEVACRMLEKAGIKILQTSSMWETSPVDTAEDQPWYINAVLSVETDLNEACVLSALLKIEEDMGRQRTYKNAARIIDMDLIDYDGIVTNYPNLTLPHPRMHERGFVLLPLQEIAPNWQHPRLNVGVDKLLSDVPPDQQMRKVNTHA